MSKKKAVIGLGNPLRGDDGIGIHILHELEKRDIPSDFALIDGGTGGLKLLHLLNDLEEAIIIDAVYFGGDPGDFVFFQPGQVKQTQKYKGTHDANWHEILQLAEQLAEKSLKLVIMGIQPKETAVGENISIELKDNLDVIIGAILKKMMDSVDP